MSQAEDLAKQLEETNAAVIAAIESCDAASWGNTTEEEGWTAAALAHHIGEDHGLIFGLVQGVATEQPGPDITPQQLDGMNAEHAKNFAGCSKAEVIELANSGCAAATQGLRALSDEQLAKTADFFGNTMTAAQIAQNILIGHAQGHLASFKAATGQA
jgi:hypothetical protein